MPEINGRMPVTPTHVGSGDEPAAKKPKLERQNGGRLDVPEGLVPRQSTGGAAPRQQLKLGGEKLKPDAETMEAIASQQQQSANAAALAKSTAEAADQQGLIEHMKAMAEMQAKSVKSSGELLKGLA